MRQLPLPGAGEVVLADTVGFINELPHELVAAFRSTLKETRSAQMLLHVVDAGAERRDRRIADVNDVLGRLGADAIPCIQVCNKLDTLNQPPRVDRDPEGRVQRVWLSARTGAGIDLLLAALAEHFRGRLLRQRICLGPADGRLRAWLFSHVKVLRDAGTEAGGWDLLVEMSPPFRERHLLADPAWSGRLVGEPELLGGGGSGAGPVVQPQAFSVTRHAQPPSPAPLGSPAVSDPKGPQSDAAVPTGTVAPTEADV
jgi:GTP-binding protein HflX